jgi:hypothetical protein
VPRPATHTHPQVVTWTEAAAAEAGAAVVAMEAVASVEDGEVVAGEAEEEVAVGDYSRIWR